MKPLFRLAIFFFALSIYSLPAQSFERSFQDYFYNLPTELRQAENGDLLFTVLTNEPLSLQTTLLYRVDSLGNSSYFPLFHEGKLLDADWIPLADGYVTTWYAFECDINTHRSIARFDAAGALLWQKELEIEDNGQVPVKLLPGPDSTFWIFRAGLPPLRYTAAGEPDGMAAVSLPLFSGYRKMPNGQFLTYGPTGLTIYSPSLGFSQSGFPGQVILNASLLPDGRIALLKKDKIILADPGFNVLQEIEHGLAPVDQTIAMATGDSSIWLLAATPLRNLQHYDLALNLLETKTVPATAPFQPYFPAVWPQRLALLGEETGKGQVVCLRVTEPAAAYFDALPDAALTDITMPHLPVDHYEPMYSYHYIQIDSIMVTVKNEGTAVLDQVTINSVLAYDNFICQVEDQFQKTYTNLELQPGQSTSLYVGSATQPTHTFSTLTGLCFWTTLPNDSLDHDPSNNMTCKNFPVLVAISDPAGQAAPLQIVPNPARDICTLSWPGMGDETALIRVFDMAGQKIAETSIQGHTWSFERGKLPAGIYNVLVINENGRRFIGKVIFD